MAEISSPPPGQAGGPASPPDSHVGVGEDGLPGDLPHPHSGGQDRHRGPDKVQGRVWILNETMSNSERQYYGESNLEADHVADEVAGGSADHGDSGDGAVLGEEAPEDHVPLPDARQVPDSDS